MKSLLYIKLTFLLFLGLQNAMAQDIPDASPWAEVSRMIGRNKVTMTYYSPLVKGRKIWGEVVPYGKTWRTGANSATKLTIDEDIWVSGQKLTKGSWNMTTLPTEKEWEVIFKKDTSTVKFMATPRFDNVHKENLEFRMWAENDSVLHVQLEWEKMALHFELINETKKKTLKTLNDKYENWYNLTKAAYYLQKVNSDLPKAKEWAEKSIALKNDHFYNTYILARIYAALGDIKKAATLGEAAFKLGKDGDGFFEQYRPHITADLAEWKKGKKSVAIF